MWKITRWFDRYWWQYLLKDLGKTRRGYSTKWTHFWCRVKGHPEGVWFYNPGGSEPDMTCKTCGEDLE